MGFFKTAFNEFGKKTGKAMGNKLYGAYADDRRVGVNRGKLKGESDGLKITSSETQQNPVTSIEIVNEQNNKLFEEILNIELNPIDKNSLLKSLTTLSTYVELGMNDNVSDEIFVLAKSKFNDGVAMLQAIDPNNSMLTHFQKKSSGWKKKKIKTAVGIIIFLIVCFAILICGYFFADML
ncbi:hypothetical protein LJC30_02710 [Odoribacter sp. OttesenSCG-928-L07]|nr:hypothetical protein [Odoribacter sp. OttesenSCG-928-L07]MDL2238942.1 hypothetical protein [Bacteroidales bacterium OttesenSCG-928-L14]